jgi:hypothetical protein
MDAIAGIDWNGLLEPPNGILIICGAVAIIALIAPQWRSIRQHADDVRLKEQMVQRGFTADEIEQVLNAGETKPEPNGAGDDSCRLSTCRHKV